MKLYKGTIVFGTSPQPHDGGYGPSYNILVKMDDPDAPGTENPKTNPGEARVFRSIDHSDIPYMQTLQKGDRVTMVWNERGNKSFYSFITPDGPETPMPNQERHQVVQSPPLANVLDIPPNGNMAAWAFIADYVLGMYEHVLATVAERYPDLETGQQHSLAQRIHGWSQGWWRPGSILAGKSPAIASDEERTAFLSMIDQDLDPVELSRAWLQATLSWIVDANQDQVLTIITRLGIKSKEWLNSPLGQWELLNIVQDYWFMEQQDGMSHDDIAKKLTQMYDLPANEPPEPIF